MASDYNGPIELESMKPVLKAELKHPAAPRKRLRKAVTEIRVRLCTSGAAALDLIGQPAERRENRAPASPATSELQRALNRISTDSLRGNLSFLSSDLVGGPMDAFGRT